MPAQDATHVQAEEPVEVKVKARTGRKSRFCAQMFKTEMCRFYNQPKGCKKDADCPFAHSASEIASRPDLAKTSICIRWEKGECPHPAEKCRYAHGEEDRRFSPFYAELFGKNKGEEDATDSDGDRQIPGVPAVEKRNCFNEADSMGRSTRTGSSHSSRSSSGDESPSPEVTPVASAVYSESPFSLEAPSEDLPPPRQADLPSLQVAAGLDVACPLGTFAVAGPMPGPIALPVQAPAGSCPRSLMQGLLGPDLAQYCHDSESDFVQVSGNAQLASALYLAMPEVYED